MAPDDAATMVDVLRLRARAQPDRTAYIFLADGETESGRLTYAETDRRARAVAAHLRQEGVSPGERALIAYPSERGHDYVVSFLGCLYAGVVALPCDAPHGDAGAQRLRWIARDADPRLVLGADAASATGKLKHVDVNAIADDVAEQWRDPRPRPEALALLQYTSGSTSNPRGVMVSHANIMANEHAIATTCRHDGDSTFVGWLPLFHDMGMIANVLQPIYLGSTSVLMPPAAFLARPARWLAAISRYGGVTGGGPNFGYDLCASRVSASDIDELDLSTWRVAFNGAEVVRAASLRRFTEMFARAGFAPETFFACYGLAEATLIVAGAPRGAAPRVVHADPVALRQGRVEPAAPGTRGQPLVSSGAPVHATRVAIVETTTADGATARANEATGVPREGWEVGEATLGEVWVSGPGVAGGYWRQPEQSAATFGARLHRGGRAFLRTGDIGALVDGELYVVGRVKDVIIIRGQNHYPNDLEWTAERSHRLLRPSCGAAFSVDVDDAERLVIVYEVAGADGEVDTDEIAAAVRRAISERHHLDVHAVALARRGSVAKTTSGKVRRRACREAYLAGILTLVGHSVLDTATAGQTTSSADAVWPNLDHVELDRRISVLARALRDAVVARAGVDLGWGIDDPLSGAGLDSVAAIEISHIIGKRYGVELVPLCLLSDASVTSVAADVVRGLRAVRPDVPRPDVPQVDRAGPLTPMQSALWYESQLAPPGPAYTLVRALRWCGAFDRAAFDRACRRLVARHPALRTRIEVRGEEAVQVVTDGADVPVGHEDVIDVLAHARQEAQRGLAFTGEALFRLTVLHGPHERVVVFAAHHAVADLWSFAVVVRELVALYGEEIGAAPVGLAPPRTTLIGHAQRERAWFTEAEEERLFGYWRSRLDGAPAALDLPLDRPRPPVRSFRGASVALRIEPELTQRLKVLSREHQTTLFITVLTAFQVLLGRHCGQRDIVVGVLSSGRDRADVAELVGCLVNPVPVRTIITGDDCFRSLLGRARDDVRRDLAHAAYPFGHLVGRLDPPRVAGRSALVQALVAFQQAPAPDDGVLALAVGVEGRSRVGVVTLETVTLGQPWTHVDLTLNVAEIDGALIGNLEYDAALFDEETIARLADRLRHLLGCLCGGPDRPLRSLSVLAPGEREAIVAVGTGASRPREPGQGLHHPVLTEAHPDRVAVSLPGADTPTQHMSYATLRRWSRVLARRLHAAGVEAHAMVGVLVERSLALPVALLAVLRRGAAYLPLDPDDPPERLAWLIADAGLTTVITTVRLRERLPRGVPSIVEIDPELIDRAPGAQPSSRSTGTGSTGSAPTRSEWAPSDVALAVHPDQAAYVTYTSGSTGRPKGVVVGHAGIVNRLLWMQEALTLTGADRVIHKAPITFDVSVWELFWPLAHGACLVLAPPGWHRDPHLLAGVMRQEQVTTAHFVPSLLGSFLSCAGTGTDAMAVVRLIVCSGEALPGAMRERVHRGLRARLVNLYGPTEASVDVTAWGCQPGEHGAVPIGLPITNADVHVLDATLEPVPANVRGEVFIGGVALARGYLGRAGLTAAAFLPNPWGSPGSRLYRTGDHARRRRDGAVLYLGRTDDQVKIAGVRIELGEVTEALREVPGVRDAAVALRDDAAGTRLVAYVVGDADAVEVRRQLRQRLPGALVPAEVIALAELPRTGSGKLDRHALAPRDVAATLTAHPDATAPDAWPPLVGAQRVIAEVWARVLGHEQVSADQDFFALGGDSIRAIRLVAQLRAAGIAASVAELVSGATIRSLAAAAGRGAPAETDGEPESFELCPPQLRAGFRDRADDVYPVSLAQQAVLFHQLHDPGHEVYVTSVTVRSHFHPRALRAAADAALRRHAYLRSSFDLTSHGEPLQIVHPPMPAPLTVIDIRAQPSAAEGMLADWMRAERKRAFDVTSPPLVRFTVHRRADTMFTLTLSSFALDGWCTATVLTEFLLDYATATAASATATATATGTAGAAPPPPPTTSYACFVALERAALASPAHRAFWAAELEQSPSCLVPHRRAPQAPAQPAPLTERHTLQVNARTAEGLRRLANELAVPLKSVLLAAHLRVVRVLTGCATVLTGLEMNGRPERADGDRVVGVFNNIVPLRVDVSGGSWADLARATWAAERRVAPFRRFPLTELDREHGAAARFNTLFVFTHFHIYEQLRTVKGIELVGGDAPDRTYVALTAHANIDARTGGLRLLIDVDPAEITARTARTALGLYDRALTQLAVAAHTPHSAAPMLSPADLARALRAAVSREPARVDASVVELIGRQITRTPDAVAIIDGERSLTYAALARRSHRLAAALRAAGVGPESRVGLLGERSLEVVIAILAILRAGGAYVPLGSDGWRLADISSKIDLSHVVTATSVDVSISCLVIDAAAQARAPRLALARAPRPAAPHPDSLAYCLATSGTTGQPKLIGVPHSALANYLRWCAGAYLCGPGTRTPVHSSIEFDLTVTALLAPLTMGGTVELLPTGAGPEVLGELLATGGGGGLLKITPAHLEAVGLQLRLRTARVDLGCVVVGGEQLQRRHLRAWAGVLRPGQIVNEYGPTEATVGCCVHRSGVDENADPVPIGHPIPGTRAYVLDDLWAVPPGVTGELHLGGACLARGYLGQPGLTASLFLPDPFGVGARVYRTGDLAYVADDDLLRFVGRRDRQLKVRGHRVEPAEIERELCQHPKVREAAVTGRTGADGRLRLVAYWVPAAEGAAEGVPVPAGVPVPEGVPVADIEAGLPGWLARRLPTYLVPDVFVRLPALPLTTRGKVNYACLPDPVTARRDMLLSLAASHSDAAARARLSRVGATERRRDGGAHQRALSDPDL